MKRFYNIGLLLVGLLLASAGGFAQTSDEEYQPRVGQDGKDVVWVPTEQTVVDTMLDMAKVTPQDFVIDLGSGDGRTVIAAAKRGAKAMGIEYNPDMVELAKRRAAQEGVTNKAEFYKADLFESDFSKATVITMFLLPDINLRLRPKLLEMKPGTRVVSNSFTMGEWEPDETRRVTTDCANDWCTAYFWIVPAKVAGIWNLSGGELTLNQEFQKISGNLNVNGKRVAVQGKLSGDKISFSAGGVDYSGVVEGNTISGTRSPGGKWQAVRK